MVSSNRGDVERKAMVSDTDNTSPYPSEMLPEERTNLDRKLLLKLDFLLVPMMGMLYLLSFLDRANIGNARVAGLQKDLGISDLQYQTAITVTYVPYIVTELPSNLLIKKIGPRILLPALCVCWGIVTTLQSQVNNYSGLIAARFFLGMLEGGLFPGIVLYLSSFYRRHELQMRVGLFFSAAALSGAFSGLLAAAIQNMEGLRGLRGWQWIFLLEGLFTVLFGIFSFLILPNDPSQVFLFSPEEVEQCTRRLAQDTNLPDNETVTLNRVLSAFKDPHILNLCAILFCSGINLYGLSYFTPSIVQALGYSPTKTQLLTVPPFACAFVATMIAAYFADRYKQRGITSICTSTIALVGAGLGLKGRSIASRYASIFLLVTGIYATAPSFISWMTNNTSGHVRRATAIAMAFVSTNSGGIVSTWIYPRKDTPYYVFAAKFNLAVLVITIVLCGVQVWWLMTLNRRKKEKPDEVLGDVAGMGLEVQLDRLGDRHPEYRYTY
ncbi:MFS transporter [Histoplasma ohiense]|nr:MFS transporter [Histoplasma ohiense (nom. inval.)]